MKDIRPCFTITCATRKIILTPKNIHTFAYPSKLKFGVLFVVLFTVIVIIIIVIIIVIVAAPCSTIRWRRLTRIYH